MGKATDWEVGPEAARLRVALYECAARPMPEAPPPCRRCGEPTHRTKSGPRRGQWTVYCGRACGGAGARASQPKAMAEEMARRLVAANRRRAATRLRKDLRAVYGELLRRKAATVTVREAVALGVAFGRLRWYVGYRQAWAQRKRQLLGGKA